MYEDQLNNSSLPAPSMPLQQQRLEPLNLAGGERLMQEVSWEVFVEMVIHALPSVPPVSFSVSPVSLSTGNQNATGRE